MRGMPYTPTEALGAVAHSHARLVDRGADHEAAVRLVADQYGLKLDVARWAVSKRSQLGAAVSSRLAASPGPHAQLRACAPPRSPVVAPASSGATARPEPAYRAQRRR